MTTGKIIQDIVHGYIDLASDDLEFVDTPLFQRLKRIKQTTAFAAYPNANHTRFEHSLGVKHLGLRVFDHLVKSMQPQAQEPWIRNTIQYACLLHDIGHAPFSHCLESLFDDNESKGILIKHGLSIELTTAKPAPHELMSCAISLEYYKAKLESKGINLDFFCRLILGIEYPSINPNNWLNPLIKILNSKIDVDKFDYLVRDNEMTGVNLIAIDKDRVINSYEIRDNQLAFSSKVMSVISNLIHGRNAMYTWVYNHHIVVYYSEILKRYMQYLIDAGIVQRDTFFSVNAIKDNLIDDYDIFSIFKTHREKDDRTRAFYNQIFNRAYLKPLWKTPFEYDEIFHGHGPLQDEILAQSKMSGSVLETRLRTKHGLRIDQLYVFSTDYKPFNPYDSDQIYLIIDNKACRFTDKFTSSIYSKSFKEIPFIFTDSLTKDKFISNPCDFFSNIMNSS
jgi:HD superfamily phosphohydrolase